MGKPRCSSYGLMAIMLQASLGHWAKDGIKRRVCLYVVDGWMTD